ncbi:putative prefoldin [Helianthus annuus]|nr:putative prefoldin [Helianthus annuus]
MTSYFYPTSFFQVSTRFWTRPNRLAEAQIHIPFGELMNLTKKHTTAMATSSSASSTTTTTTPMADPTQSLLKQARSHEVSIAELSALSSSRTVYQKNGNIFFRTSVQQATASEKKQLDMLKAKLQKQDLVK